MTRYPQEHQMSNPYDTATDRTSVLGPTIRFKGELSCEEDLVIHGKIEGTITRTQRLTIGREGTIHANIDAAQVIVEGSIEGDVHADKSVSVTETANVTGNITAPAVSILQGARFNGSVDMSGAKAAKAANPTAQRSHNAA
jgi:cytoskeletal protein CcmA (bactofilin family)